MYSITADNGATATSEHYLNAHEPIEFSEDMVQDVYAVLDEEKTVECLAHVSRIETSQ